MKCCGDRESQEFYWKAGRVPLEDRQTDRQTDRHTHTLQYADTLSYIPDARVGRCTLRVKVTTYTV